MTDEKKRYTTPEGRLINSALFEKEQYNEQAKFKYNAEMAFDPDSLCYEGTPEEPSIEDGLIDAAIEFWGEGAEADYLEGRIRSPLLDGDRMAAKREANDKPGDAYKGKLVIRATTQFNKHYENAAGGIAVWGEDLSPIDPSDRERIYNGSMGELSLTIDKYVDTDRDGNDTNCLMFYLKAYHKTGEGERLVSSVDTSTAFKAVGRAAGGRKRTRKS